MAVDLSVLNELEALAARGSALEDELDVDLEEVCSFAARLRCHAPAALPLDAQGMPSVPLPRGFWLPWPSLEEMPRGLLAVRRAPPPELRVEGWEVSIRPLPPATWVLYTVDGSVPRQGAKGTQQAAEAKVQLEAGGQVYAAACGRNLQISDLVTFKRPGAQPKEAPRKAGRGLKASHLSMISII